MIIMMTFQYEVENVDVDENDIDDIDDIDD